MRNDKLAISMGAEARDARCRFADVPLYDATTHVAVIITRSRRAALSGRSVNLRAAAEMAELDFSGIAAQADDAYRADSFLAIPLKNSDDHVLGVLQVGQCPRAGDGAVIPFDANLQQMMESYSSLAVAALEAYIREQGLRQQIQQLRIEIDEAKRQKQVDEIVETDFFQDLQAKARAMPHSAHARQAGCAGRRRPGFAAMKVGRRRSAFADLERQLAELVPVKGIAPVDILQLPAAITPVVRKMMPARADACRAGAGA